MASEITKRGLVFAKYGTLAASTRQRFAQTIPFLAQHNIAIDIHPLFDNAYLESFFQDGRHRPLATLRGYGARLMKLLHCGEYDFLWVQYELLPYLPGSFEAMIRLTGKPVIYDFDDAIFHRYDQHPNSILRRTLGNKLAPLLRYSAAAFCGNAYLEAYAKRYCRHTEIIPTTVDTTLYAVKPEQQDAAKPTLGWIGSPSTWSYCKPLEPVFASFVSAEKISVLVIGAGNAPDKSCGFTCRDWTEKDEITDIQSMDIGIMPVFDDPWARGKCGYKLIQYMACSLPVIASPVGVNRDIVEHGVNGFLAATESEWRQAIEQLIADPALRKRMGRAGRAKVEQLYSIQIYGPKIAKLIQEVCSQD